MANEMAHWVKLVTGESEDMSSLPGTDIVEGSCSLAITHLNAR